MSLAAWAEDLAYTLKNSGHGPEQITLASADSSQCGGIILATARKTAKDAGWPVTELAVEDLRALQRLPEYGYLIIHAGTTALAPEVTDAVAAFQHLVTRDLQVALLVLATPEVIRLLRREPALGWLSRACPVSVPSDLDGPRNERT